MNEIQVIDPAGSRTDLVATTFSEDLFLRWVAYIDAAPKTVQTYTRAIKRFYVYMTEQGISSPTREDVVGYRDYLKAEHKPTTVQSYMAAVKLFFQWTAQEGLYPDIAAHIKGAKLDNTHKKDCLSVSQTKRMLNGVDRSTLTGKRDYAILFLMVTTGLRTISLSRANIEDLRNTAGSAVLYHQGKGHEEKGDYVKLSEPVEEAIADYLKARQDKTPDAPLFASVAHRNAGGRMTTRSISRVVKTRMQDVGLDSDRLTAHSLRHTAATLNLMNGGTVEETQQLLGHRNINTTLIYAHALERAKNDSENRITDAIMG